MIKIPYKIPSGLKRTIKIAYAEATREVGEEEALYVNNKLDRKLKLLRKFPSSWHADIASVAESLCNLYVESLHNPRKLLKQHKQAILAALFYLCDPYDVIPDFTPGTGYVDDAYVFNLCLERIKKSYPRIHEQIMKSIREARE